MFQCGGPASTSTSTSPASSNTIKTPMGITEDPLKSQQTLIVTTAFIHFIVQTEMLAVSHIWSVVSTNVFLSVLFPLLEFFSHISAYSNSSPHFKVLFKSYLPTRKFLFSTLLSLKKQNKFLK